MRAFRQSWRQGKFCLILLNFHTFDDVLFFQGQNKKDILSLHCSVQNLRVRTHLSILRSSLLDYSVVASLAHSIEWMYRNVCAVHISISKITLLVHRKSRKSSKAIFSSLQFFQKWTKMGQIKKDKKAFYFE